MTDTEKQLNVNQWKSVSGNNVTFWLLCHHFPHMHFTKHDTTLRHVCSTTPTNMSLIDNIMSVTVFISSQYFELFCVQNLHILCSLQSAYLYTDTILESH